MGRCAFLGCVDSSLEAYDARASVAAPCAVQPLGCLAPSAAAEGTIDLSLEDAAVEDTAAPADTAAPPVQAPPDADDASAAAPTAAAPNPRQLRKLATFRRTSALDASSVQHTSSFVDMMRGKHMDTSRKYRVDY